MSKNISLYTKYGKPSDKVSIGLFGGKKIAFIPRHGVRHTIPPHKIPYKANISALKSLNVDMIISTCIVGSLKKTIKPGTFVIPDQYINMTWGRDDSYDADGEVIHLPMAKPYCETLRQLLINQLRGIEVPLKMDGTVVVIQGPRFSTVAESRMYSLLGGDIVNMTQYPECYYAKEMGICYATIASVTDYDVGVQTKYSFNKESISRILSVFERNIVFTTTVLKKVISTIDIERQCSCAKQNSLEYYKIKRGK